MNFLKYLFLFLFFCLSSSAYSAICPSGIQKDLSVPTSVINSPQTHVCNNDCRYRLQACVDVDIELQSGICSAISTGETCSNGNPDPEPQPTELECTSDMCYNPNNLRCPSGYTSGSFNGQRVCARSSNPDPIDPECPPDTDCNGSDQGVINAVNNANADISGNINNLSNNLGNALLDVRDKLNEIADKIANLGNGSGGNNNGNGENEWGDVDTSPFTADLPVREIEQKQLSENLFSYNAQCPPDNTLNMNFLGHSVTYTFSYSQICDALHILGYFVLLMAYLYAAYIVSRA